MFLDATLPPVSLLAVPDLARAAETVGFDALWSTETQHDPFLPLALAAEHTQRLHLGTAIAVAFARSPAVLAYTAWDLAEASHGRFLLGLGTQVRAHIERRFGMPWPDSPTGKLRAALYPGTPTSIVDPKESEPRGVGYEQLEEEVERCAAELFGW